MCNLGVEINSNFLLHSPLFVPKLKITAAHFNEKFRVSGRAVRRINANRFPNRRRLLPPSSLVNFHEREKN